MEELSPTKIVNYLGKGRRESYIEDGNGTYIVQEGGGGMGRVEGETGEGEGKREGEREGEEKKRYKNNSDVGSCLWVSFW